jgi:hypothetical protein
MTRSLQSIISFAALLAVACAGNVSPALAQNTPTKSWPEVKCERYGNAWTEALTRRGRQGLSPEFIERHEAFIASGCTTKADVCPRSTEELDMANIMVVAAMNAGTASTFPPFACRK